MAAEPNPSAPLCVCGIRGCDLADVHAAAFVTPARGRKGMKVRHRKGRGR